MVFRLIEISQVVLESHGLGQQTLARNPEDTARLRLGPLRACSVKLDSFATPWPGARQASLSLGFSRQQKWGGLPFPPSRGSSQPRDKTCVFCVSCIGRWVFVSVWRTPQGCLCFAASPGKPLRPCMCMYSHK